MSMISDLVGRLRVKSKLMGEYGADNMATLLMQASDTIEMLSEKARADRPQGEWIEVYAETDYRSGWIEFTCERCGYQHGLESGEYGWSYGDPIPWKFCPICGARMKGASDDKTLL